MWGGNRRTLLPNYNLKILIQMVLEVLSSISKSSNQGGISRTRMYTNELNVVRTTSLSDVTGVIA